MRYIVTKGHTSLHANCDVEIVIVKNNIVCGSCPGLTSLRTGFKGHELKQNFASIRKLAMKAHAVALSIDFSQSLASLRHVLIHAKVRSTTQRLGKTSKPFALSDRLIDIR